MCSSWGNTGETLSQLYQSIIQARIASAINTPVNQLRDPALFFEGGKNYLLYSVRGENGIGIVQFSIKEP